MYQGVIVGMLVRHACYSTFCLIGHELEMLTPKFREGTQFLR